MHICTHPLFIMADLIYGSITDINEDLTGVN